MWSRLKMWWQSRPDWRATDDRKWQIIHEFPNGSVLYQAAQQYVNVNTTEKQWRWKLYGSERFAEGRFKIPVFRPNPRDFNA